MNTNSLNKIFTEKFYFYYIVSLMLLMPVAELISELLGINFVTQPVILSVYGIAGLFVVVMNLLDSYKNKKAFYPSDMFFILLVLFATISLIFSKDIYNSTIGWHYDELPMHFMAYFSLMFAGTMITDDRLRKKVLYTFVVVAAIQGVVAFFQTFGLRITECFYDTEWHTRDNLSYGLTQHNNWFAGLSTIFAAACAGLFIFGEKKKKLTYLYLVLAALSVYVSFCTGARIAWVGNAVIILFYIVSLTVMKIKKYDGHLLRSCVLSFLVILAVYAVVIALISLSRDTFASGIEEFKNEDLSNIESLGTARGYIWKYGLESVPHNWLTGVGLDNYVYAFYSNPNWSEGMRTQAKGHNEYLHTLVTQGVFAALNYIALLVFAASTAVKDVVCTKNEEHRRITWILLGMFFGYAAQAFFNSSVINTAMYFWIVIGMTVPRTVQQPLKIKSRKQSD